MDILYALDLTGTGAFAAAGALAATRRRMDLMGVLVLGLVTAAGGGTLRDVLLGDFPPFCLVDETYLYLAIAVSLLVFFLHRTLERFHQPLLFFDAVGLGTFAVIGTGKAMGFGLGFLGSVMMGVVTATAGGVVRDVLANRVPLILQREVYATAALAGSVILALAADTALPGSMAAVLAALAVVAIRLAALRWHWSLPRPGGAGAN